MKKTFSSAKWIHNSKESFCQVDLRLLQSRRAKSTKKYMFLKVWHKIDIKEWKGVNLIQ